MTIPTLTILTWDGIESPMRNAVTVPDELLTADEAEPVTAAIERVREEEKLTTEFFALLEKAEEIKRGVITGSP